MEIILTVQILLLFFANINVGNSRLYKPKPKPNLVSELEALTIKDKERPKPDPEPYSNSNKDQLLIGGFNMKKFGSPKIEDEEVLDILVKIVQRYDLLAVSEITDKSEKALKKLMSEINKSSTIPYHYHVSSRVGRSNNKEQYAFIYRPSRITVKHTLVYNDSNGDPFAREPFIGIISPKDTDLEMSITTIHVRPSDAPKEIDALYDVDKWIESKLKQKERIIIGDLNADCSYVRRKDWANIRLRTYPMYNWLIDDKVDTTVANSDCAYDRIITIGQNLNNSIIVGSPRPFKFDEEYGLDDEFAFKVSDHYPIEFILYLKNIRAKYAN